MQNTGCGLLTILILINELIRPTASGLRATKIPVDLRMWTVHVCPHSGPFIHAKNTAGGKYIYTSSSEGLTSKVMNINA